MKLNRMLLVKKKISLFDLRAFARKVEPRGKTLIVYIEFKFDDLIRDYDLLPHWQNETDRYYPALAGIGDESYESLICTGLIEHMRDPAKLVEECHRVSKPGGRAYVSASAVFAVHRGPEDYYHLTQYGARHLFERFGWSELDIAGSCGPFRALGINCQRILLQCEVFFVLRPFVELLAWTLPLLDVFVIKQYHGRKFKEEHLIDTMMPSNIQIIATK